MRRVTSWESGEFIFQSQPHWHPLVSLHDRPQRICMLSYFVAPYSTFSLGILLHLGFGCHFQFSPYFWPYLLRFYLSTIIVFERSDSGFLLSLFPLFHSDFIFFSWPCSPWAAYLMSSHDMSQAPLTQHATSENTHRSSDLFKFLGCATARATVTHSVALVRSHNHSQVHSSASLSPDWVWFCLYFCSC